MSKKCPYCGVLISDMKAGTCSSCKTILPSINDFVDEKQLTHEQEVRIAEMVANRLVENSKFKWKVIGGVVGWIFAILGVAGFFYAFSLTEMMQSLKNSTSKRLSTLDVEMTNRITATEGRIEITISNQFADPHIKDLMNSVAATQASNLLIQQISPQIVKFNESVNDTLKAFNVQLTQFEMQSSNAIADAKSMSDFSILLAKANADDYLAFQKLVQINVDSPFLEPAREAVNSISDKISLEIVENPFSPTLDWSRIGITEPDKAPLQQYEQSLNSASQNPTAQTFILNSIYNNNRFSKHDRIEYAISILTNSPSLLLRCKAGYLIEGDAKCRGDMLDFDHKRIDWWNAHSKDYTNGVPNSTH